MAAWMLRELNSERDCQAGGWVGKEGKGRKQGRKERKLRETLGCGTVSQGAWADATGSWGAARILQGCTELEWEESPWRSLYTEPSNEKECSPPRGCQLGVIQTKFSAPHKEALHPWRGMSTVRTWPPQGSVTHHFLRNWIFFVCLFVFSKAVPTAYGGPQSRGLIGAVAASLHHSHARSLTHWERPGIKITTSWFLVRFVNHWARTGTPEIESWANNTREERRVRIHTFWWQNS